MEKIFSVEEESRRELADTDYQVTRVAEELLPRILKLLDDNGIDTSDVDLTRMDSKKRAAARARIQSEKAKTRQRPAVKNKVK